ALRLDPTFVITGNYAQRNFNAYYAGTNLPTLFKQQERGKFRAYGGSVMLGNPSEFLATADFRSTNRGELGEANRFGGDVRWAGMDAKLQMGAAMHRVKAFNVLRVDRMTPSYSLSHWESRAWAMYETGRYSFSLDGIHQNFDDRQNPNLNGEKVAFECVGSAGVRFTPAVKVSADLSYGTNALFKKEVRGLLRAEYRFTLGRKGGSR
ncbi:MAG: hypothetical protein LWX11_02370, partial [Firmicutes bacterium]|nr:hypothetical protein [Bacillota bacterium]